MKLKLKNLSEYKKSIRIPYRKINNQLIVVLKIIRIAGLRFGQERAPEAAASMAFYTLLSLFPLILVLISFASFVLKSQFIQDQILTFIVDLIPVSPDLITTNIENVLSKRGTVGAIAMLGLMWSASSMFNTVALNIDRAWPEEDSHNFFERRAIGFAILIGLLFIIVVFWSFRTLIEIDFFQRILVFFKVPFLNTSLWDILLIISPRVFRFFIYWIMFQWIPKAIVRPNEAILGAIVTSLLNELITWLLKWYLGSQWVRYELIYGSLGRIIALLLWIYFSSIVILFGAHISSAIAQLTRKQSFQKQ